jgi:hypothetical protein
MLLAALALLLQLAPSFLHQNVELLPDYVTTAPVKVSLPRNDRLDLNVIVRAPNDKAAVETLAIRAENQQTGYWTNRPGPNLFVTVTRAGEQKAMRRRIFESGGGQTLRDHYRDFTLEMLDSPDKRTRQIRHLFKVPDASAEAAIAHFDQGLVDNPPGRYDVVIEYKPATGVFAGRTLGRRLQVDVPAR